MNGSDVPCEVAGGDNAVCVPVDPAVYSRAALLRACYWITARAFVLVSMAPNGSYNVTLKPKSLDADIHVILAEFTDGLLESELRSQIASESGEIRRILVQKAFGTQRADPECTSNP